MRTLSILCAVLLSVPAGAQTGDRPAWPAPPAAARVRYVRALTPGSIRQRPPSAFSRLVRVLVGSGREPQMAQPYGVTVGPDGRVFVADTNGGTIHVYDVDRSRYSSIHVDAASLIGIAVSADQIYVTDSTSGRLICLEPKGKIKWVRGRRDGFERPTGIVAGGDRLYVVDTLGHRIVMVGFDGSMLGAFGARGAAPGQFNFPTNIARAADGRLFVTDTMNFRVQVLDGDGRVREVFGRLGDGPGDFDKPKGVAVDSGGHVYVVEGLNDRIQIFEPDGRLLLVFGGSGSGDGQLWLPAGIAIANDYVYVADSANRRLQVYEYVKERTRP